MEEIPDARQSCVATSGCQATTFHLIRDTVSVNLIIGSFFLKSQTTHFAAKVDAKICCTWRFHEIDDTSSNGWDLAPKTAYKKLQFWRTVQLKLTQVTTDGKYHKLCYWFHYNFCLSSAYIVVKQMQLFGTWSHRSVGVVHIPNINFRFTCAGGH